ncbi:peptidyl-tRNA hydrolase [Guyanagaster necrorhizus]|uniref:peptidyl-tRNA hydrolase n=1 Tax=Guyanagaster necrorhizus TaxID=856835 RepID=A0A9P7VUX1_9AGAR|nr:peptidyl-tRNA hydrolase [Guyanagaster necrorhizus MCA 3950]KAG7446594.1 peptidyl-tRNA hydrolase [Guyanagaster necrorhizus MCA 3950]
MTFGAPQLIIVGLGNLPMPLTRHSVGQLVVDALASRLGIHLSSNRRGISGQGTVLLAGRPIALTLFKSKKLMNISGPSIVEAYRATVSSPSSMIVISDSLSHKPQTLSARLGGSANGHNGLKSIMAALGGENRFWQFRAGIGRDESETADYVLRKLSSSERSFWENEGLDKVLKEIEKVVSQQK